MKKKLALLLALCMLAGCLTACGQSGKKDDGGSKLIGVCMQNMSSSIAELEAEALVEMFEPLGYDVQVVSADDSVSNQTQQIQNFILMDAEMLVVLPCEIETLEDCLLDAKEAGIKVVISGGTGTISEDAYDAVSCDDEFLIGMFVASAAKTWVEANMDPNGDWDVAFLSSTISDDAKARCAGEAQILEPWLKNMDGEYVNLMGDVVPESERIENPIYCEMIASRVDSYDACATEMDISGDNRSVVAGVLTDNDKVRVIIAYNSLVSTAGSQYIMDTYPKNEQKEFAFFSGGVMGDEYEYLIGAASDEAGTPSVFRGACQFGGGDAAATLANLAYSVMFGEAGVDYGKSNPNSIGLYFPIDPSVNNGVAALVCFDTPRQITSYTYEEILAQENLMVYWDSVNGYNKAMQESAGAPADVPTGGAIEGGTAYTSIQAGIGGDEAHEIDLMDDGTCRFSLPGNAMITDVYAGTYSIAADGVTVSIKGLTNVDPASPYPTPGLWSYIDGTTGDAVIIIDPSAGTFTPAEGGAAGAPDAPVPDAPAPDAPAGGTYTCELAGMMGTDTLQFVLNEDGTCQFSLPGNPVITDVYAGTYTRDGNAVAVTGLTNVDPASEHPTPGLWSFIDSSTGDCAITVDDAAGTFTPVE
ncbi:MAG: substrate-binding domain-containing protein [Oscillospiraceae bacterium]